MGLLVGHLTSLGFCQDPLAKNQTQVAVLDACAAAKLWQRSLSLLRRVPKAAGAGRESPAGPAVV